jgi:hypothetical protein
MRCILFLCIAELIADTSMYTYMRQLIFNFNHQRLNVHPWKMLLVVNVAVHDVVVLLVHKQRMQALHELTCLILIILPQLAQAKLPLRLILAVIDEPECLPMKLGIEPLGEELLRMSALYDRSGGQLRHPILSLNHRIV